MRTLDIKELAEESRTKCTRKVQNLSKDTLDKPTNHKRTDHPKLKQEENARERDAVYQYFLHKADSKQSKHCLVKSNETSIANDEQPLDMRSSQETIGGSDHPKVPITGVNEAEDEAELSSPTSYSAVADMEMEPVSTGLLGRPPPQFNSFPTGIKVSTLKHEEISTPPNGDFINPPNVTVTHSSPIALPFSFARSSSYLTLLTSKDIEAVLCEPANKHCQQ